MKTNRFFVKKQGAILRGHKLGKERHQQIDFQTLQSALKRRTNFGFFWTHTTKKMVTVLAFISREWLNNSRSLEQLCITEGKLVITMRFYGLL